MYHKLHKLCLLLVLAGMSVAINAQTVTKTFKDTPLKTVLEEVEAQTGYSFMYRNEDINQSRLVTATFKDAPIASVLDKVLGSSYSYDFKEKIISITKVAATKPVSTQESTKTDRDGGVSLVPVSGKVVDGNGLPIIGAVLTVAGQNGLGGVTTGLDGRFSWKVPKGSEIQISCIGYQAVSRKADGSAGEWDIVMGEDTEQLEESIVVGYGVQRKESVVGAITQIATEDIVNSGLSNVTQAITGKLSGVLTMQSSGQPGSNNASILVRGVSSWNGSDPLVMVDGVERAFDSLDPNEIATISVLKDASATAVFGAKGANGVILVTTRTGQKGKARMNLTVSHGLSMPARIPEHQDAYTTASALNIANKNGQNWGLLFSETDLQEYAHPSSRLNELRYPDVDWYDVMLKDVAHSTDANLNVSGGTDRARYFVSLGFKNEGSLFKMARFDNANYNYNRLNYRANLDLNITSSTVLTYRVGGAIGIKKAPGGSPISGMFSATTIGFPAYYPAWLLEEIPDWDYPNASGERLVNTDNAELGHYYGSPYNKLNVPSYDETTSSQLYTDILLNQDLGFITNGLSVQAKFSFSTNMSRASESVSKSTPTFYLDWGLYDRGQVNPWISKTSGNNVVEDTPFSATQGGVGGHSYNLYWESSINYDRTWNSHHVTALALVNQRENKSNYALPYRSMGVVGRLTYDYRHKYLIEGNMGYTGPEQFAPANRFGLFPSIAIGYVISQENWWKQALPWWSKFKLRFSDGYVGNDGANGERWLYFSEYSALSGYIYEDASANQTAQWEMAHKQDLGIEMGWFDNRLSLELDLFGEHRTHMLVAPVVPIMVGTKYKRVNKGEMKKRGFELELQWEDSFSNGLGYFIKGMYAFNENRIINYEDPPYLPEYQKVARKPYKGQTDGVTVVDSGYYSSIDDVHLYPSYSSDWTNVPVGAYKYLDYCPDGTISANDLHAIVGSQYPSMLGSMSLGFNWKGWEFSMMFYGNFGKYADYNASYEIDFVKGDAHLSKSMADFWSPTNSGANHATLVNNGSAGHPMYSWAGMSGGQNVTMGLLGRTWRKVDYVNLRDLYLGYTFNPKVLKQKVGVRSLTIYSTGNNLLYFTDLIEGNPELSSFSAGAYPLLATVQLGLKVGF